MYLVVGLGNPGSKYLHTRHNVGFVVVQEFASPTDSWREKFHGKYTQFSEQETSVVVLKPETFMNLSGKAVRAASDFFRVPLERVIVVHDELDLPFGHLRLKCGGGDGGHKGLRSVSQMMGSPDYVRLRVGIGRPADDFRGKVADFVLQPFAPHQTVELNGQIDRSVKALRLVLSAGVDAAMNQVNRKQV